VEAAELGESQSRRQGTHAPVERKKTSMLTVLAVCKSGGIYDAEWVRKLRDAVGRNLTVEHRFVCLSDIEVPCERIALEHDWPGWWSKIEIYRPGVITGPTLYLDLDIVVTGNIDFLANLSYDFMMLENFHKKEYVNSSIMWCKNVESIPQKLYTKFLKMPDAYIGHYKRCAHDVYIGDQAYVWDTLGGKAQLLQDDRIKSYKYSCQKRLPEGSSIVCFHGPPRPSEVKADWLETHWR